MSHPEAADEGLRVGLEGGKLVISIGINCLAFACVNGPVGDELTSNRDGTWDEGKLRIIDAAAFAQGVRDALTAEAEDGTTAVHTLLDAAFMAAVEGGCDGVELGEPRPVDEESLHG